MHLTVLQGHWGVPRPPRRARADRSGPVPDRKLQQLQQRGRRGVRGVGRRHVPDAVLHRRTARARRQSTHLRRRERLDLQLGTLPHLSVLVKMNQWLLQVGNDRMLLDLEWTGQNAFVEEPLKEWTVDGHGAGLTRSAGIRSGLSEIVLRDGE